MMVAALTNRERWMVIGGGLLAAIAAIAVGVHHDTAAAAFPYPPHARLLMLPFGAMAYGPAAAIWSLLNLFCLYRAAELIQPRRELALFAALSPAALMIFASGYPGGFLALMASVVVMQGREHPARAGLCLALMTVEPQLALLFGLMLLLLGYRRAVMIAIAWILALLAASIVTLGVQAWVDFLHVPGTQAAAPLSVDTAARMAGLPGWAAQVLQWSFGFVALVCAAMIFLRRGLEPRSIALLLLAIVLALPVASSDSFAVAAPALTLALFAASPSNEQPFLPLVPAVLLWIAPALAVLCSPLAWPVAPVVAAVVLLIALAQESAGARDRAVVAVPVKAERERVP